MIAAGREKMPARVGGYKREDSPASRPVGVAGEVPSQGE
jgi:hypothetical protein